MNIKSYPFYHNWMPLNKDFKFLLNFRQHHNVRNGLHYLHFRTHGHKALFVLHGTHGNPYSLGRGAAGQLISQMLLKGYDIILPDSKYPVCPKIKSWDFQNPQHKNEDYKYFISTINYMQLKYGIKDFYCVGFSSGGFMASYLAEHSPMKKVIIHSAGHHSMVKTKKENNCRPHFNTKNPKISSFHCPFLVINNSNDKVVPPEMGRRYADASLTSQLKQFRNGHKWKIKENKIIADFLEK